MSSPGSGEDLAPRTGWNRLWGRAGGTKLCSGGTPPTLLLAGAATGSSLCPGKPTLRSSPLLVFASPPGTPPPASVWPLLGRDAPLAAHPGCQCLGLMALPPRPSLPSSSLPNLGPSLGPVRGTAEPQRHLAAPRGSQKSRGRPSQGTRAPVLSSPGALPSRLRLKR